MAQPKVKIACVSNLYSREMLFENVGDSEQGHTHKYDHMTFLAYGRLRVITGSATTDFTAPQMIFIDRNHYHELIALAQGTVAYCIHPLRSKDTGDILDPSMIPAGITVPEIFDYAESIT
jgi:hypothetical protein